jgi:hypothetical protein
MKRSKKILTHAKKCLKLNQRKSAEMKQADSQFSKIKQMSRLKGKHCAGYYKTMQWHKHVRKNIRLRF